MTCDMHSYSYMLEAFVDKIKGRKPVTWCSAEDSISYMTCIDTIYEKVRFHYLKLNLYLIYFPRRLGSQNVRARFHEEVA